MEKINVIDLHCDTVYKLFHTNDTNLYQNSHQVDILKLQKGNSAAQFFALFIDKGYVEKKNLDIYTYTKELYNLYRENIESNKKYIDQALNYKDMISNMEEDKLSAFLTIEEGDFLQGKIERLEEFYNMGLRLVTLTWNYVNCIGYPNSKNPAQMALGLKKFGFEVIERMNDLGMIVDVSHLSDGGFNDVVSHSQKPIIASHSNARTIHNVPRNLSDEMIRKISDIGGVIGINFYYHFLGKGNISKISAIIEHIKYIKKVGGIECIALGSDFDGIEGELEITNIGEVHKLQDALRKKGMKTAEIEKISWLNAARVIKDCLN